MNNSKETLERISKIDGLEDEIVKKIVNDDLNMPIEERKRFIMNILGDISDFKEESIRKKMIELYKKEPPYIGYCHKYWETKKEILKNPWVVYD